MVIGETPPGDYPTVSVVTPSYNQGEFLPATIESVLGQEGDFFLEYLIMDGGSTDDSVQVMRRYQALIERGEWRVGCRGIDFHWLSEKDRGQADAVNKGFARATGGILGWLNSDDTYLPGALAQAVRFLAPHTGHVMVYGNAWYTDRAGSIIGSYSSSAFDLKKLAEDCYICQPSVFFRTEALKAIGLLDVGLHTCMDYELWIRMGKRFESKIAFIETYLATSRMYGENKTLSLRDLIYKENMSIIDKHFGYVPARWIIHSILEVFQTTEIRSLPKMLSRRSYVFRYLARFNTVKSILAFSLAKLKRGMSGK